MRAYLTSKAVLSTRGRLTVPKAVRLSLGWAPGTRLIVEDTADGVVLKVQPPSQST